MKKLLVLLLLIVGLAGCERELRRFGAPPDPQPEDYTGNAYATNNGKRLFRWYNCNGCHAAGGGGIGPPLMDAQWRYGDDPHSIYESIMRGRPNGMPAFGGRIPEDQAWQIVAYVRSMSGGVRKDVAPSRADSLSPGLPENARPKPEGKAP